MENPFVNSGYAGPEYFCDRKIETNDIVSLLVNGNNIALISPRRYGKTDLIRHCFGQERLSSDYYTFIIDIYSTKSLSDFVNQMGKVILDELKPKGKKAWNSFVAALHSVSAGITYDAAGNPSWVFSVGDIKNPSVTLDEIFHYLQSADKPCIVAIDEFQQITKYADDNVEAILRTYVQYCNNAKFIFSGSQRHLMGSIFTSPSRPFYQSVTIVNLGLIPLETYFAFCKHHFESNGRFVNEDVVQSLYNEFDGITFYLQKVMNILYMRTPVNGTCDITMLSKAVDYIIDFSSPIYEDLLYQMPEKQKQVLLAISAAGKAVNVTSGSFAKRYGINSPSSVNSAIKGLLEKDLITHNKGVYQVYDKFLDIWLHKI